MARAYPIRNESPAASADEPRGCCVEARRALPAQAFLGAGVQTCPTCRAPLAPPPARPGTGPVDAAWP